MGAGESLEYLVTLAALWEKVFFIFIFMAPITLFNGYMYLFINLFMVFLSH